MIWPGLVTASVDLKRHPGVYHVYSNASPTVTILVTEPSLMSSLYCVAPGYLATVCDGRRRFFALTKAAAFCSGCLLLKNIKKELITKLVSDASTIQLHDGIKDHKAKV